MAIRNKIFIILFILLGFLYAVPVRAGVAPQSMEFLERYQLPLRWDNVEGSPVWLSGAEPQYSFKHKYHIITLQPGDDVTIRLPAHALARIIDPEEALNQTTLKAFISRGNGLFLHIPLSVDENNTLYVQPDFQENGLLRLKTPSSALDSVQLSLFVSRYEPHREPLAYRQLLELSAPTVDVQTKLFGAGLDFQQLSANRPSQVRIKGPLRLLFEHRLIFPPEGQLKRTPYTIKGLLDTRHVFTLSSTTPPESKVLIQADDLYPTLGLLRKSYITFPEGEHILTLIPDCNLLLRLTARDEPDYLFPDLNDPFPLDEPSKTNTDPFTLFSWSKEPSSMWQPELAEPLDRVRRLWQNNRYPDGGLSVAMAFRQLAERYPGSTDLLKESKRIEHEYTFYRDLFPETEGQPLHQKYTAHFSPKLKADANVQQRVLQHNMLPTVIDTMERAYFTDLPVIRKDEQNINVPALTFLLPKRQTPSDLRILVDTTKKDPGSFTISMGDKPPIKLELLPHLVRPADEFELAKTEAAINLPTDTHSHFHPLSPRLDSMGRPTTQQHVAELIIPLDTIAEKIVLHPMETNKTSLRVALQYRESKPFQLAETEYLRAKEKLGREITPYDVALMMLADPQIEFEKTGKIYGGGILEIEAFLRPLIRYIHTRDIVFSSSVHPTPDKQATAALSPAEADSIRSRISLARKADQWVSVLENAVLLYHGTQGQNKIDAAMLIVDALESSGEPYLAEMRLRGMMNYPQGNEGENLAKLAKIRLEKLYQNRKDLRSLSILYATCLRRNPSPQLLEKLAGILLQEGRFRLALSATVILPANEHNSDYLLRSTLKAGWNQIFESEVKRIGRPDEQNYWRGLLQEKPGAERDDNNFFMAAGSRGKSHSLAMEQANAIETQLNQNDLEKRQQAIFSWEQWQEKFHGPYSWKNEPWLISDHAGGVFLYSEAQDFKLLMFKATQERPVQARIWGPVTMKLIMRPLHTKLSNESLSGWGFLRIDDELELIPINNNRPVQQWVMPPAEETVPGRVVLFERHLGPGYHEISVSSETLSLLVALQVHRPESNNGLPALSYDGVARILQDVEQKEKPLQISRLGCLLDDSLAFLPPHPEDEPLFFSSSQLKFNRDSQNKQSASQAKEAISRLEASRPLPPTPDKKSDPGKMTRLMAAGKWDEALAAAGNSTIAERFRLMSLLAYLTEIKPAKLEQYETRARDLFKDHPLEKELHTLLQRISAQSQWKQVEQIQGSAGLRIIPMQNWLPESPTLRIRKALLTTQLNRDAVLTSKDPLVLFLNNLEPIELEVSWKLSEVAYLHPESLDITYHLDDEQEKNITFSSDQPEQSARMTIPAGRHRLVTTIKNRYSNQFLQVRFQKISPSSANNDQGIAWDLPLKERAYHVVTRDVPLRASIHGPAWVRFDEHLQDDTFSHYRYIKPGWQTIEIRPDINQQEMLVRLFQRAQNHDKENEELSRKTIRTYPVLQPPLLALANAQKSRAEVNFVDNYEMGRQEDGTWSSTLSWHKRRDLEEDAINGESEKFFQFTESYYHYYDSLPAYLKSSFFVRKRTLGGPTIGLTGDVRKNFKQIPITFRLVAEGLTQNPDAGETAFFDRNPMEWSLRVKASFYQYRPITPKLKHRPGLLLFGRLLSLDDGSGYDPGTIDQDIFTQYKSDHPSGINLSEFLIYRPWLDTALFARGSYTTNADMNPFNPDSVRLSGGVGQMIGPATLDFRYQITHFFDDEDRTRNIDRNVFSFGLNWDHWLQNQSRIQLGLKMFYRLESKDITGTAGLTWFFSTSRAMRDLSPEDELFYTIKTNRASQLMNNGITDAEVSP